MHDAVVLCYHAIGEGWSASVSPDRLRQHVELLLRRRYRPATFSDVVHFEHSKRTFAVTFDDAWTSVLERAFPVLAQLGVPATVFAVTTFADDGGRLDWPGLTESGVNPTAKGRRSLTWAQLAELAEAGWEVGSHTCTHPRLTQLDNASLDRELRESRSACARALGRPCRSIAYPYGDFDARVLEAAAAAGYDAGCSLSVSTRGPLAWPRVGVYGLDTPLRFRLKVSPLVLGARRALSAPSRTAL